jgi:intracellular sulfur oxidation DsrE/DsrF family protein
MFMAMLVLWAVGSLSAAAADQPAAKPKDEVVKVVYHADFADPRRFSAMLANIYNMVSTYQSELKEYDVRIVFLSHGIRFVTQDKLAGTPFAEDAALKQRRAELLARLATLRDTEGVKLELCEITREAVRLPREKIIPGVTSVPSGVVRIVELQHQGFAYLKVE